MDKVKLALFSYYACETIHITLTFDCRAFLAFSYVLLGFWLHTRSNTKYIVVSVKEEELGWLVKGEEGSFNKQYVAEKYGTWKLYCSI